MDINQNKIDQRALVIELILLSFAISFSILAVTSSYQLLVFSEIRVPDIYYEFEGMYLLFLLLCVFGLIELVFLIHLFCFLKWRKNVSSLRSIFVIVIVHLILGLIAFFSIKYTIAGSNSSEISKSFYIFVLLLLIECGFMAFILNRLRKTNVNL